MGALSLAVFPILFFLESSFWQTPYIQTHEGTLPVVISVSHGGSLKPLNTVERNCEECVIKADSKTIELSYKLREELFELTGKNPSLVINNLHRSRLDLNRDLNEAIGDNKNLAKYWFRYHIKLDRFLNQSVQDNKFVLYLDIHGHTGDYLLIGYNIPSDKINTNQVIKNHSFTNTLLEDYPESELTVGDSSLGAFCETQGILTYPSNKNKLLWNQTFFDGGYNVEKYLVKKDVIAIQLECGKDQRLNDKDFPENLAKAINSFLEYLQTKYN